MKLNIILIGSFVLSILIISTFAYISATIDNKHHLEVFLRYSPQDNQDNFSQIESEVTSRSQTTLIVILSLTIILSITVGFVINFMVGKPIGRLTNTVDEISKGNLEIEIGKKELENKGEIGDLARSLQRVMASMKLAVLRKGTVKKGKFDKPTSGISEKDLAKSGLLSKPTKETNKITSAKSNIAVIKKPLVTFQNKEENKDKMEINIKKTNKERKKDGTTT